MNFGLDDAADLSGSRYICFNDFNVLSSILKGVCMASPSDALLVIAVVR
jgi:hypothetical protein